MRQLLCRRYGNGCARRLTRVGVILAVALGALTSARASDTAVPAVRITSPIGRTGLPGMVRIVARVTAPDKMIPTAVRFYVNDMLLSTDADGPPYVAEWDDSNPFERCKLAVEVEFESTQMVRDEVDLDPLEILETAQVLSVGLEATVQDRDGRYIPNLQASDFDLLEDGAIQALDSIAAESLPAMFTLLIDTSQSMSRSMNLVRAAAAGLIDYVGAADGVVVVPFKTDIISITGPTHDRATVADAVSAIRPAGGTAILDALAHVADRFVDLDARPVIVLVTDGYDEASETSIDSVLPTLKRTQATIHVIAIGGVAGVSLNGEALLRRLAQETGGRAYFPWNRKELAAAHAAIAADARSRYRMTYTPENQRQDGTWRRIEVRVKRSDYRVRARSGYTAPVPPPVRASLEFAAVDTAQQQIDLARDDLEIIEDGVPQKLEVFHEAVAPVSIMLALDSSGSMKRSAPTVQDAVRAFIGALRPDDPLGLMMFADSPKLVHGFSHDREESLQAVDAYIANGGTALYDALGDGLTQLATREGRRVLIIVSDGRDENATSNGPGSVRHWEEVLTQVRDVDATIYVIGLGSNVDKPRLEQLASLSGGEAYFTTSVSDLEAHYRRILEELRRRYAIAYTSTNGARDGAWRTVEIRVRQPGVRARSRGGYFAPQ